MRLPIGVQFTFCFLLLQNKAVVRGVVVGCKAFRRGGGGVKRRRVQSRVRNEVLGALTCGHANVHGRLELVVKGKRG
jgi:hypothetical protein